MLGERLMGCGNSHESIQTAPRESNALKMEKFFSSSSSSSAGYGCLSEERGEHEENDIAWHFQWAKCRRRGQAHWRISSVPFAENLSRGNAMKARRNDVNNATMERRGGGTKKRELSIRNLITLLIGVVVKKGRIICKCHTHFSIFCSYWLIADSGQKARTSKFVLTFSLEEPILRAPFNNDANTMHRASTLAGSTTHLNYSSIPN